MWRVARAAGSVIVARGPAQTVQQGAQLTGRANPAAFGVTDWDGCVEVLRPVDAAGYPDGV